MIPAASAVRTPIPAAGSLLMWLILADGTPGAHGPRSSWSPVICTDWICGSARMFRHTPTHRVEAASGSPANGTRFRRPARWPTRRGGLHPPGVASPVFFFALVLGVCDAGPNNCRSGLRTGVLAEDSSQGTGRLRRQVPGVVVEHHVHLLGLGVECLRSSSDLLELLLRVVVVETLGDAAAVQVALRVAPVAAHVGKRVLSDGIDRRENRHVVAGRRVDADEDRVVGREPVEHLLESLGRSPAPSAELDGDRGGGEAVDDRGQLVEIVLTRIEGGGQLEEV